MGRPGAGAHRGLVGLAWASIGGTALELAMLRHWGSISRTIPWALLGLLTVALVRAVRPGTGRGRLLLQGLTAIVVLGAVYGVADHVSSNLAAGPLDFRYADRWASMPLVERLWAASTGAVGPAPTLAPAMLALAAALVWLVAVDRGASLTPR